MEAGTGRGNGTEAVGSTYVWLRHRFCLYFNKGILRCESFTKAEFSDFWSSHEKRNRPSNKLFF
jgi:hypothetical protein